MTPIRLVTLAPGHFHAALIQKESLPGIDPTVTVYAPFDADLLAHLQRIHGFNSRAQAPTQWKIRVESGPDWLEKFQGKPEGTVAVLAGRNRRKIGWMREAVEAGLHVLADKPWIIEPEQLPDLADVLRIAAEKNLIVHDVMTERFEITSLLQRDVVCEKALFGEIVQGSPEEPAVAMTSIHYLKKTVAGAPLRRPAWFFDVNEQGEALADVGTHLVDLVQWMLFTDAPLDPSTDLALCDARRWPTKLPREQFMAITGERDFPAGAPTNTTGETLLYYCNTQVVYAVRGVHVRLDVLWDLEAPPGGGDTHQAVFRGTHASAAISQQPGKQPELYIIPADGQRQAVREALKALEERWQKTYPGVAVESVDDSYHVTIPEQYRTSHEKHFAEVTEEFRGILADPTQRPAWETPHLLAKYAITTHGVALARRSGTVLG